MEVEKMVLQHLQGIKGASRWVKTEPIEEGWSREEKYRVEDQEGNVYLLRLSSPDTYDKKKRDFDHLQALQQYGLLMPKGVDFGLCEGTNQVYTLLSWIEGQEAESILPSLSPLQQYNLGIKGGRALKTIHRIPVPKDVELEEWSIKFDRKIGRNIDNYNNCEVKFDHDQQLIQFVEGQRKKLKNVTQCFHHGDYHVGNMIITDDLELGIIDFNRADYGDPWEEFNRIIWCAQISPMFATGLINGYFPKGVPEDFFNMMALYIASNQLGSIPWALSYGDDQVKVMLDQVATVLEWYDNFKTTVPSWYVG